ncbi:GTPase HflX [Andreprevotia sp. IGB-42]|uniref:GTPase HflX n=1 Tax=Andreprevotia sp. IGB-42 TaxID=2497473 RepID=UPI0013588246|nr:GTPase HflX [Andreprevotia sp. IGB-42]KAF0814322.1 GTPase HflX [Andreprevotia sp. IGB-42]
MFERHKGGDAAVLVCLDFNEPDYRDGVDEFVQLVESAGVAPLAIVEGKRARPDPAYFAGSGKVDEIGEVVRAHGADMVIFNHQLSPAQERNLERKLQCRVLDRTTLILDIFAQRARTAEGKLQVELAQLAHIQTRLIRGWTHLERQKGGVGMRGPGETQLETDRRLIGIRVKRLREQLVIAQKQRATQRKARVRRGEYSVSIVGYTNAGKSTLFNALTKAKIYAADQLFATLDTTSRKLFLDAEHSVVISDTVGFIRNLPHTLVAAFRATLEETIHADLLLHVVDVNHPMREAQVEAVNYVLGEIDAERIPQLMVWNKIDLKDGQPAVERDEYGKIHAVRVSAMRGEGLDLLRAALVEAMSQSSEENETT